MKTMELKVRASTWASIENLARLAAERTKVPTTPEQAAATLLEVGLRTLAADLKERGGDENIELARALLNFHAPTSCSHVASIFPRGEDPVVLPYARKKRKTK